MKLDFDAAIFDMDGTLLNTMAYWRFTTLEFLLAHQLPVKNEDLVRMFDTSSRKLLFEIAERDGYDIGERQAVITELEDFMERHYQKDSKPKPGVPEFLQKLKDAGIRMCVATGSPRGFASIGLVRAGVRDFFEFVTDTYEFGMDKSNPEYFHVVAKRLGTTADRCVVFEDALYAMKAAKEAGCTVVAIEDETARLQREEIMALADIYVRGYDELM